MWTEILHLGEDDLIPVKSYHKYKLKSMEMYKYRTIEFNSGEGQKKKKKIFVKNEWKTLI